MYQPPCRLPEQGYWFAPTVFTNVAQSYRIAQEEIFGPVLSVLTFRTPEEAVEKANNTPYGLSAGVWTEKGSRILWMAERLRAGVVWANTFNRFDPASPFGGYKESGFGREGGRHGLEPYLRFERVSRIAVPVQDVQALHRRCVPALRVGPHVRGRGPERRPGLAQGRARCGQGGARGRYPKWAGATPYNRGQVLYRLAEMMEARAADLARRAPAAREVEARDRSGRLVRRLGRQAAAGARWLEPGRRPVLQLHRARADRRRRGPRARASRRSKGSSRASRRRSSAATPSSRSPPRRSRSPRSSWQRRSPRATCPAASSTCSPATATSWRRSSPRTWTSTRSTSRAPTAIWPSSSVPPPTTSSASSGSPSEQSPWEIAAFLELKTVWHPVGVRCERSASGLTVHGWSPRQRCADVSVRASPASLAAGLRPTRRPPLARSPQPLLRRPSTQEPRRAALRARARGTARASRAAAPRTPGPRRVTTARRARRRGQVVAAARAGRRKRAAARPGRPGGTPRS